MNVQLTFNNLSEMYTLSVIQIKDHRYQILTYQAQFSLKKCAIGQLNIHRCLDRQTYLLEWKPKMNVKTLIATVTLLTSTGAVFAGNVDPFVEHTGFVSSKTRAEVIAETQQAAAKGDVARTPEFVEHSNVGSARTREDAIQVATRRMFNSFVGGR